MFTGGDYEGHPSHIVWSPGRAIVLPPGVGVGVGVGGGVGVSKMLKFLCDGQGAVRRAFLSLWQVLLIA